MPIPERFLSLAEKLRELGATNLEIAYIWDRTSQDGGYLDDHHIHEALKEINPQLAEKFFREMRIKVWRSDLRKEHFNRRRIVESLHREAKLSRGLAEKIAREVEEKIKSMDISIITAPLIRELVLGKLIEDGLLNEYTRYMRLGIPVYDLEKAMEKGNVEDAVLDSILQQYVLFEILPRDAAELYLDGSWKIWGMARPNRAYARAFIYRTPSVKAWIKNLIAYLTARDYVDTPSVHIPKNVYNSEAGREILEAVKEDVILWASEDLGTRTIPVSKEPIYSFGHYDAKVVGDVFQINIGQIAESTESIKATESTLETIRKGMQRYTEFKGKYVKRAEYPVIITGVQRAENALMLDMEKIKEMVAPLRPFKLEE
ncbi:MAG: hypothetical protein GXN93_00160 [Candidatus Diapherotrites archaeon]|nr:hypothetical protein [Candidatus Diapherotrites archaeon]